MRLPRATVRPKCGCGSKAQRSRVGEDSEDSVEGGWRGGATHAGLHGTTREGVRWQGAVALGRN